MGGVLEDWDYEGGWLREEVEGGGGGGGGGRVEG